MVDYIANNPDNGIGKLSYEEARSRLVEIVTRLEQGSISLEESLTLWEQGEALARHCQSWLDGARKRLQAAQDHASATPDASVQPSTTTDSTTVGSTTTGSHSPKTPADSSTANHPDSEEIP
ncbi:MAG: exodeoxyribonuclease VII small subunit [Ancrocorticia sp.]